MKETVKTFKVWITKYALTQGIHEVGVRECLDVRPDGDMVERDPPSSFGGICYHGKGRDWHETKEGAIACADEMRRKKIASLKKQIAKLEKINFA
jgi:hypothetical protein